MGPLLSHFFGFITKSTGEGLKRVSKIWVGCVIWSSFHCFGGKIALMLETTEEGVWFWLHHDLLDDLSSLWWNWHNHGALRVNVITFDVASATAFMVSKKRRNGSLRLARDPHRHTWRGYSRDLWGDIGGNCVFHKLSSQRGAVFIDVFLIKWLSLPWYGPDCYKIVTQGTVV